VLKGGVNSGSLLFSGPRLVGVMRDTTARTFMLHDALFIFMKL
jgi:hypothetical protein